MSGYRLKKAPGVFHGGLGWGPLGGEFIDEAPSYSAWSRTGISR